MLYSKKRKEKKNWTSTWPGHLASAAVAYWPRPACLPRCLHSSWRCLPALLLLAGKGCCCCQEGWDENENDNFAFLKIVFEFFLRFSGLNGSGSGNRKNENDNRKRKRK
jgi:hypothetical protein